MCPSAPRRTAHYAGTHEENAQYHARNQPATPTERLRAAACLNSAAYGYDAANPPRLDRTAFATRRHPHGDLDVWVKKSAENYRKLTHAVHHIGTPVFDMAMHNFLDNPATDVFAFGRLPVAIDIMTKLKGLEFAEAYESANEMEVK